VRSKHRTVDHKNETIAVDFWGPQLLMFFTEVTAFQQTMQLPNGFTEVTAFQQTMQLPNGYKSATLNENTHWSAK